ncbi:MAG TPA: hypothetical protein VIH45_04680 [Desulfuromonadaceae bacterium]
MSLQYFGQYLVEKGAITPDHLAKAVGMQEAVNRSFGGVAQSMGLLSSEEVMRINRLQHTQDLLFGDAAIRLGLLSSEQVASIISRKQENHLFIGEALVAVGALRAHDIREHLHEFERKQARYKTSGLDIPPGVPFPEFCRGMGDVSHKILSRVAHVTFKPDVCEVVNKIDGNDNAIIFDFTGDINFRYYLTFPRQVRNKIAIAIISTSAVINEKRSLDGTVHEFSRIVCGHVISRAAEMGKRLVMLNCDVVDHDEDIPVPQRNIGLLFPVYLPTGEWIDIALVMPD